MQKFQHIVNIETKKGAKKLDAEYMFYSSNLLHGKKVLEECHSIKEAVEVERGTIKIASCAFNSCDLKEVKLPDSLESIEPHAFFNCQNLHKIVFGKDIKTIENDSFVNCPAINEIVFPENTKIINELCKHYDTMPPIEYNAAKYSLQALIRIAIKSESREMMIAEKDKTKKLRNFFKSGIPESSVKLTVGRKSIWIPKAVSPIDEYSLKNALTFWLRLGGHDDFMLDYAPTRISRFSMAVEMYAIDKNKKAKEYLKVCMTDVVQQLIRIGDNEALTGVIKLGLIDAENFNKVLEFLINNQKTEVTAYVMAQMKEQNIPLRPDLTL